MTRKLWPSWSPARGHNHSWSRFQVDQQIIELAGEQLVRYRYPVYRWCYTCGATENRYVYEPESALEAKHGY